MTFSIKNLFFIIYFCSVINAQDSAYTLQPVEVVDRRPINYFQSFESLSKNELQKPIPALSLEETFSKVPGVLINDRNNPSLGDRISIRGIGARSSFGVRGIKILVDNIPLTLPDGQSQTNNIDLFSLNKVDILRGTASSYYGNAAGGVINFQTGLTENEIFNVSPEIIFGSYGLKKYAIKFSGQLNSHSYLLSFNNLNHTGFREHSERKIFQLNTIYKNNFSEKINFKAVINYFNAPYLLNPGSLSKETLRLDRNSARELNKLQGTGEKANQFQSGINFNFLSDDLNLETTLYIVKRDLTNPIPGRIINLNRTVLGLRSFINKKFFIEGYELDLSGGIDIEFQNDLRKEFENEGLPHTNFNPEEIFSNLNYGNKLIDQDENVFGIGPFISAKFLFSPDFGFLTGLRNDNFLFKVNDSYTNNSGQRKMNRLSPAVGSFYRPDNNFKIYLNYSTSFQTPTTSELSNRPDAEGGFNPILNPEKIYQAEFGCEYLFDELNASISSVIYYLNFTDLIIQYQIPGSEEFFFRNAGKAENKGAEVLIETKFTDDIGITVSYSIMNFIFKDYIIEFNSSAYQLKGNKVPGVPQQSFYFQIDYTEKTFETMIKLKLIDKYFTNDFNGPPPGNNSPQVNFINESYIAADIRFGYNITFDLFDAKIFLGINNLLNRKYNGSVVPNAFGERFFEPAPLRNWFAGLRINY